jgi:hypothetical protein
MSASFFGELARRRTINGAPAEPQDFDDAFRALADQAERYIRLDDEFGYALCSGMIAALIECRRRPAEPIPF